MARQKKPISPRAKEIARIIRETRDRVGDKQETLANLINTSRTNYLRKEHGEVYFSLDEFLKIMEFYSFSINADGTIISTERGIQHNLPSSIEHKWLYLLRQMVEYDINISKVMKIIELEIDAAKDKNSLPGLPRSSAV